MSTKIDIADKIDIVDVVELFRRCKQAATRTSRQSGPRPTKRQTVPVLPRQSALGTSAQTLQHRNNREYLRYSALSETALDVWTDVHDWCLIALDRSNGNKPVKGQTFNKPSTSIPNSSWDHAKTTSTWTGQTTAWTESVIPTIPPSTLLTISHRNAHNVSCHQRKTLPTPHQPQPMHPLSGEPLPIQVS